MSGCSGTAQTNKQKKLILKIYFKYMFCNYNLLQSTDTNKVKTVCLISTSLESRYVTETKFLNWLMHKKALWNGMIKKKILIQWMTGKAMNILGHFNRLIWGENAVLLTQFSNLSREIFCVCVWENFMFLWASQTGCSLRHVSARKLLIYFGNVTPVIIRALLWNKMLLSDNVSLQQNNK